MSGLYVHVPFCIQKCHYCDFVIASYGDGSRAGEFLSALAGEIEQVLPEAAGREFETLYLGGGTPSALDERALDRLLTLLRRKFRFTPDAEVTCEANPGDLSRAKACFLKEAGVNRVSLGAQSFNDATLKRLNRSHGSREIYESFEALRGAGFVNLNADLMLALPGEKLEDVEHSLEELLWLGPRHISLYELTLEEGTLFGRQAKKGELELPDEDTGLAMLTLARERLKAAGYEHYEVLNYAKPGFRSRHNLLYWANEEVLGLGPGAWSYTGGKRSRRAASYEQYIRKAAAGDWRLSEEERLDPEARERESLLLALRLSEGADAARFASTLASLKDEIAALRDKGLLEFTPDRVRLTPRGQFFAETVFSGLSLTR